LDWFRDTLEVLGSEVLKVEQIAEKPARALGDERRIWRGDALEARCKVRRLSDDTALRRKAAAAW
jgi:hypothetical protein